uniref:dTDP-4-dehydrorhamnose 3,5-epimerase family protein n=1 Tax=Paenibacillus puerhi TaxID=2692622 RepID=UPI0038B322D9
MPKGFPGFITLTDEVEVQYKVDELYAPDCDRGIIWNDPYMGIKWTMDITPILSKKDEKAPLLKDAENNFSYGE